MQTQLDVTQPCLCGVGCSENNLIKDSEQWFVTRLQRARGLSFVRAGNGRRNSAVCPPESPLTLSGINLCLKLLQHQLQRAHGLISGFF